MLSNPWQDDRLDYESIGVSFTNLIKSMDEAKVLSIEAGFGRGKTFFRKAWCEHLRQAGEVVVEIDVQQSDHSGDPIVTLLGALAEQLPLQEKGRGAKAIEATKKLGVIGAKTATKIALRSAADELIDTLTETALDKIEDFDALEKVVTEIGEGMSKAAGQMIASQMAAEKVRRTEMPEQLQALQAELTKDAAGDHVVVVIDELDRCHPDYAISVLEAMKLVFNQSGFVFCLMVNADYLENLAHHRFGASRDDEKYLDKFVDIRLRLEPSQDSIRAAVVDLVSALPLAKPYGEGRTFSLEAAGELASDLAVITELSMRKIKRVMLKVEMAMRCYSKQPLDPSLLVFLAFSEASQANGNPLSSDYFPRSGLTPKTGKSWEKKVRDVSQKGLRQGRDAEGDAQRFVLDQLRELTELPTDRYRFPDERDYKEWIKVLIFLAPHYIPSHQGALNQVSSLLVEPKA